jgi:hypothetical protein
MMHAEPGKRGAPITTSLITIRGGRLLVTLKEGADDCGELPELLIRAGHRLTLFREDEINLETAFKASARSTPSIGSIKHTLDGSGTVRTLTITP